MNEFKKLKNQELINKKTNYKTYLGMTLVTLE